MVTWALMTGALGSWAWGRARTGVQALRLEAAQRMQARQRYGCRVESCGLALLQAMAVGVSAAWISLTVTQLAWSLMALRRLPRHLLAGHLRPGHLLAKHGLEVTGCLALLLLAVVSRTIVGRAIVHRAVVS